jgi:hypothetical protein
MVADAGDERLTVVSQTPQQPHQKYSDSRRQGGVKNLESYAETTRCMNFYIRETETRGLSPVHAL